MNYEQIIMEHNLKQIIKNLKKAGIDDITSEDTISIHPKKGKLKIRFYTEEQWLSNPMFKATTAQIVMKQAYKGCKKPDNVVTYKEEDKVTTYFVKVIK